MKAISALFLSALLAALLAIPAQATSGPSITGGGSASDMTRFALAITDGQGKFECLMPSQMTVEATVTGVDSATATSAKFHGLAQVTLGGQNPFALPAGPMTRNASFTASVMAGGPGTGQVVLVIMGMTFAGTVVHGQITISA